jgi:hypothetical protein
VDNNSDNTQDRKRNRTRTPVLAKRKHWKTEIPDTLPFLTKPGGHIKNSYTEYQRIIVPYTQRHAGNIRTPTWHRYITYARVDAPVLYWLSRIYNSIKHRNISTRADILTRDILVFTNIYRIPSGRAIAATIGTLLIFMLPPALINVRNGRPTSTSPCYWDPSPMKYYWEGTLIAYGRLATPTGTAPAVAIWRQWYRDTHYGTHGRCIPTVTPINTIPHTNRQGLIGYICRATYWPGKRV